LFQPVNRHVLVQMPNTIENTTDSGIVLPADFKPQEDKHVVATVIAWAEDVRFADLLETGSKVVVDKSMIEEIMINNQPIHVVLDNYIIGIMEK
jgi:co-chaperonin GroES (HSP10)